MSKNYVTLSSGVIVNEASFRESANINLPAGEVATTLDGRDITRGYVDNLPILPPQDTVLQARGGGDYKVYDEVLRDDQVAATLMQRRAAVTSCELEVTAGGKSKADKAAADMLREYLQDMNAAESDLERTRAVTPLTGFDSTVDKMLYGRFYGHAIAECMWAKDGNQVALDGIKVRKARRFGYSPRGEIKLFTTNNPDGEYMPPRKFWSFTVGSDHDDDPYGLGLAHWLYWPVFFKRNGLKFWLIFLEKFGQPTGLGKYPANATPPEKSKLLSALRAIQTDSGIILPQGMEIELIEASRSGTADYVAMYDRMNQVIAKVALGQTQTIEAAGGQYKSDIQHDVMMSIAKADSDLVHSSFMRGPARWLTQWNYPTAMTPKVTRRIGDEEDLKTLVDRDKVVFDMGFKPSLKHITDTYGGEWQEHSTAIPSQNPAPTEFAEKPESTVDKMTAQAMNLSDEPMAHWLKDIKKTLDEAETLEDFSEALQDKNKHLPPEELTELMQHAFALAELQGRSEVNDETSEADDDATG